MAEGSTVGMGGCISASQSFAWFSERWDMTEIRMRWPHLTKNDQAHIACFETLAQLALAMTAVARVRTKHFRFILPAASDTTSAESGVNRLFTTSEPLSGFLKIVAAWSAHSKMYASHSRMWQARKLSGQTSSVVTAYPQISASRT